MFVGPRALRPGEIEARSAIRRLTHRRARAMVPMAMPSAFAIADLLSIAAAEPVQVLDIAAGHGMFGIVLAERNPKVNVVAVDWAPVLAVAEEHARAHGVHDRYRTRPGGAFKVNFGEGYDVALVTSFLHHFDQCSSRANDVSLELDLGRGPSMAQNAPRSLRSRSIATKCTPPVFSDPRVEISSSRST